ncbi:MAG: hypothetical protein JWO91_351 [Acidobacteriaceae bacterium]|jgi:hypothetical protein|nr:hypothetical protein [Acidobacteriaceae bacterium]
MTLFVERLLRIDFSPMMHWWREIPKNVGVKRRYAGNNLSVSFASINGLSQVFCKKAGITGTPTEEPPGVQLLEP